MKQSLIHFRLNDGRKVEIRTPDLDEAPLILSAMIEMATSSPYILSTAEDFKKKTVEMQTRWMEESAQSSSALIMAAYFDGKVVGLCDARSFKDGKRQHRAALGISIHEEFRSCGLGRKMTEILLENIKTFAGIRIIELDVMSANTSANTSAIKLYEHFGFKRAGVFPKAYVLPSGEELDNISMYIHL